MIFAEVKKLTQIPRYKDVGLNPPMKKQKQKKMREEKRKKESKKEKTRHPIICGFVAKQTRKMILSIQPIIP